MTRANAVKLGKEAKAFTAAAVQKPFTIQTRWRRVFGPTRYYALVFTPDGNDLAELLVRNGLARIYGTRTALPDGTDSRTYLAALGDWSSTVNRLDLAAGDTDALDSHGPLPK